MDSYNIMFIILAVFILLCTLGTVLAKSILRAATYLFFVLLGTSGLYFLMGYTFLGAVQMMVYAGGIVILYVFAILLTRGAKEKISDNTRGKIFASAVVSLVGLGFFVFAILKQNFISEVLPKPSESVKPLSVIGTQMLSTGHGGYMLPFEIVSVLLLACIIAALLIARNR